MWFEIIFDLTDVLLLLVIIYIDWRLLSLEASNQTALRTYLDMRNKYYSQRTKQKSQPEQRGLAKTTASNDGSELVRDAISGQADGEREALPTASTNSSQPNPAIRNETTSNQSPQS